MWHLEARVAARRPNGDYRRDRRMGAVVELKSVHSSTDEHVDLRAEFQHYLSEHNVHNAPRGATERHRIVSRRDWNAGERFWCPTPVLTLYAKFKPLALRW